MTIDVERGEGWVSRIVVFRFRRWTFSIALDSNR